MNITEHLGLNQPEGDEYYDIEQFNENAGKIDAAVFGKADKAAVEALSQKVAELEEKPTPVLSVFGRQEQNITAQAGDYTAEMVGAQPKGNYSVVGNIENLTPLNGWNINNGARGFYIVASKNGNIVTVNATVVAGDVTKDTAIAIVPEAFAPRYQLYGSLTLVSGSSKTSSTICMLESGVIGLFNYTPIEVSRGNYVSFNFNYLAREEINHG